MLHQNCSVWFSVIAQYSTLWIICAISVHWFNVLDVCKRQINWTNVWSKWYTCKHFIYVWMNEWKTYILKNKFKVFSSIIQMNEAVNILLKFTVLHIWFEEQFRTFFVVILAQKIINKKYPQIFFFHFKTYILLCEWLDIVYMICFHVFHVLYVFYYYFLEVHWVFFGVFV